MCGRFSLTHKQAELELRFGLDFYITELLERWNVAPSQSISVLTQARQWESMRWGLIPSWSKEGHGGLNPINAKAETVGEKPMFRNLLNRHRCVVPVSAFYEWKDLGQKRKQPYCIRLINGQPMALAGLWDDWADPKTGEVIRSVTLLTTAPNRLMAEIHNRMPAILDDAGIRAWLDPHLPGSEAMSYIGSYPAELMEAFPISTKVNNPRNEGPEVQERA